MKRALLCILVVGCESQKPSPASAPAPVATTPMTIQAWQDVTPDAQLPATLASFASGALAVQKKPYAYLHAEWCPPCKAIEKTRASDPQMVDAFTGTAIATIDIDAADPKMMAQLGLATGVIPVFYRLGTDGKPTGDKIDGGAWGDNIPANMAPPLKAFFAR